MFANGSFVYDTEPRTISNLIVDQTITNPAAVNAADSSEGSIIDPATGRIYVPNTAPDEGLSAPFNTWFVFFGQFFDHGLDLVNKGGNGTLIVPLMPDDPLYVPGSPTNFLTLTRATRLPGADGVVGTDDDTNNNQTSPFVDQNQTYTSHPAHQVFLREYELVGGVPVDTGRMLDGVNGGLANWNEVKAQARNILGINLVDTDVLNVPHVVADPYGNFVRGPEGFPLLVTGTGTLEGVAGAPVSTSTALRTNHSFLDDIAHGAAPDPNGLSGYDNVRLGEHFITGDGRGNENIGLTTVHHIFHSEHNRMAGRIDTLLHLPENAALLAAFEDQSEDDDWSYEQRLFQAAKFPTEMQYQHLVFEEYARRIQPAVDAIVFNENSYDPTIDPAIVGEFAHVVYRFGHSMLTEDIARDGFGSEDTSLLAGFLNPVSFDCPVAPVSTNPALPPSPANPSICPVPQMTADQAAGAIINGTTNQVAGQIDEHIIDTLRNELLGLPLDLATINMVRARDVGVPSLQAARRTFFEASGSPIMAPYESWTDFGLHLKNGDNFGRGGSNASLINFVAAYGTHPTVLAEDTIEGKRNAASMLVNGILPIPFTPFTDMDLASPTFVDDISWAYANGVTGGCTPTTFCPRGNVTREQMASFIARVMELPAVAGTPEFDDVVYPSTHSDAISKVRAAGIAFGCTATQFCPKSPVTREQMASFLARALELPDATPVEVFDDVVPGSTHEAAIAKVAEAGITLGCSATSYCPKEIVTRQQMTAFLRRGFENEPPVTAPADSDDFVNGTGAWASDAQGLTTTGLEDVDFWVGGLAEALEPFGGMLGSTFNFVFEKQLENLQFGDRFYYLFRNQGNQLFAGLEANSFSKLIQRNTDASLLPADIFSVQDPFFDLEALANPLPAGLSRSLDGTFLWDGDEHIEIHGCRTPAGALCPTLNDRMRGGQGDDSLWGYAGNDRIEGGSGNDAIIGGPGDDIITDTFGDDNLKGGLGNDAINPGAGTDLVLASHGRDLAMGSNEFTTAFMSTGDDLFQGGSGRDTVFGGEGDDWIEGGAHADLLQGDNANQFQSDRNGGHDVIIGGPGADDNDSEGGDDIIVGAVAATDRYEGMFGFDWVTFKGDVVGANGDLDNTALQVPTTGNLADRFDLIEAVSGWNHNDILRGNGVAVLGEGGLVGGHELTQAQLDRVDGLRPLLGDDVAGTPRYAGALMDPDGTAQLNNNILLGGLGSDLFEGRAGYDFIDGSAWLDVYIEWRPAGGPIERRESLAPFAARIFNGTINPGDLHMVREIVEGDEAEEVVNTAIYSGDLEEYTVVENRVNNVPDGTWTVSHDGGAGEDGIDVLRNIQLLRFADEELMLEEFANTPATGTVTFSGDPAMGAPLTATPEIDDPDGTDDATLVYTWQTSTDGGLTWGPIATATDSDTYTPDASVTVGSLLRVIITFTDDAGVLEQVISDPTTPVQAAP